MTLTPNVLGFLTSSYAISIYIYGSHALTDIQPAYYIPVEKYAAATFSSAQISTALSSGFITQQQFDETESYIVV